MRPRLQPKKDLKDETRRDLDLRYAVGFGKVVIRHSYTKPELLKGCSANGTSVTSAYERDGNPWLMK
jgi:hypothetical protein